MRVNVSYSIDLEDLPREADYLYNKAVSQLDSILGYLQRLERTEYSNPVELAELINKQREKLALVDAQLGDYGAIIVGYQEAQAQLFLAEQEKERQLNGEISPQTEELLEKIKHNVEEKDDRSVRNSETR